MTVKELQNQLTGLGDFNRKSNDDLMALAQSAYNPQYQQDVQNLRDSLSQSLAQQQRSAIGSGMQRSSYNQAAQAAINAGGLRSQADLAGTYEGNVASMFAQLLQNEDSREDTYNANRNNLLLQLYNLGGSSSGSGGRGGSSSSAANTVGAIGTTASASDEDLAKALAAPKIEDAATSTLAKNNNNEAVSNALAVAKSGTGKTETSTGTTVKANTDAATNLLLNNRAKTLRKTLTTK